MPTLPQRLLTLFVALAFTLNQAIAAVPQSAGTYGFMLGCNSKKQSLYFYCTQVRTQWLSLV
jgi:hypothetical protein